MTIDEARHLMNEWTQNPALRVHMECVAACMGKYAEKLQPDQKDRWIVCGLLHDMDYERHPTLDLHPQNGAPHLRELGYPEWFVRAVLSHANHLQDVAARESDLELVLFACDELAGFVHACGLVRPEGLSTLEPRSVRKKLKQKSFAAGVNRDDVYEGAEGLGVDLDEHIQVVIDALKPIHAELGLPG